MSVLYSLIFDANNALNFLPYRVDVYLFLSFSIWLPYMTSHSHNASATVLPSGECWPKMVRWDPTGRPHITARLKNLKGKLIYILWLVDLMIQLHTLYQGENIYILYNNRLITNIFPILKGIEVNPERNYRWQKCTKWSWKYQILRYIHRLKVNMVRRHTIH